MENIEKLKAAFEAATGGEWESKDDRLIYGIDDEGCDSYLVCDVVGAPEYAVNEQDAKNAEFIVLAHNLMPVLLEALDLLKQATHLLESPGDFSEDDRENVMLDAGDFLAGLEEEDATNPPLDALASQSVSESGREELGRE